MGLWEGAGLLEGAWRLTGQTRRGRFSPCYSQTPPDTLLTYTEVICGIRGWVVRGVLNLPGLGTGWHSAGQPGGLTGREATGQALSLPSSLALCLSIMPGTRTVTHHSSN